MPKSFLHRLVEGGAKVTKQVNETLKQLEKEINDAAEQYKAQTQAHAQAQAQVQAQGSSSGTPYPYGSSIEQHYYEQILRMQAEAEAEAQAQAQAQAHARTHAHAQAQRGNYDGGTNQYDPAAHEYRMRMAQERMDMLGSIGTNRVRVPEMNPIINARYSKPPGISHEEHMSNLRMLLAHNQSLRSAENIDRLGNIG